MILEEWFSLALRWFHVVTGIMWIGNSFYFMWLDGSFRKDETWMVHGGYFYRVEKKVMRAGEMPEVVHWFKWEATFTWLSGMALLAAVFYAGSAALLIDPAIFPLTQPQAIGLSLGILAGTWVGYDLLWASPVAKIKDGMVATVVSIFLASLLVYGLTRIFGGRGAFIHLGAVFGTLMILNVWMRILPAQRKMIDSTYQGKTPDYALGSAAKKRSTHNSYMTLPVIFVMISNHFPALYSHRYNWGILAIFIAIGMGIRHEMILRARGSSAPWVYPPVLGAIGFLIYLSAPAQRTQAGSTKEAVAFSAVRGVIARRCVSCHSASPTDDVFRIAPAQVFFDEDAQIIAQAARIRARAVDTDTMPIGNKTGMTLQERELLGAWTVKTAL